MMREKRLTNASGFAIIIFVKSKNGGIAQLGERLNGIQEVSGSIPLISTNSKEYKNLENLVFSRFFVIFSKVCHLHTLFQNSKKRTEKRTKQGNRAKNH